MARFKDTDTVVYQGHERRITDQRGVDEYRLAFEHETHTTWEWVKESELSPLVEHVPLAGGTELESPLSDAIVIVRNDGVISIGGSLKLHTLVDLRAFKAQLAEAERLMEDRLR